MGVCYYLMDAKRREVLSIGKAWWLVHEALHGNVIDAATIRRADLRNYIDGEEVARAEAYRERVAAWLDGRDGVVVMADCYGEFPWEGEYASDDDTLVEGWTGWDAQDGEPWPSWKPWRGGVDKT
jgi:hypothetical protein